VDRTNAEALPEAAVIVHTAAGSYLVESRVNQDLAWVYASTPEELVALIDQLELVGTTENPPALTYDEDDIAPTKAGERRAGLYVLSMHKSDLALFLQAEVLNFLNYRKFNATGVYNF
jgi:hypothetical protein